MAAPGGGVELRMDAGTQCQHHEHLQNAVLKHRRPKLAFFLRQHQHFPGKVLQQHIELTVRAHRYLPEGYHVKALFQICHIIRQLRQHLRRKLHPDDLQWTVSTGVFQPATLSGLGDQQILLLGRQIHRTAPEHSAASDHQKQVVIVSGEEFPDSAGLKKIICHCIFHQKSLPETVRCDSLLYTTEKDNCYNCIIHQFTLVFNHFLDMH